MLRVDLECPSEIQAFAEEIRGVYEPEKWMPGTFRLYNVDLAPKFRYCLETNTDPTPTERLRALSLSIPERALAQNDLVELRCEGNRIGDSEANVLKALGEQLEATDPDVLVLSNSDLIPFIENRADEQGLDIHLGRLPEYTQLSTESTY